jgi:uncharacterized protein YceK
LPLIKQSQHHSIKTGTSSALLPKALCMLSGAQLLHHTRVFVVPALTTDRILDLTFYHGALTCLPWYRLPELVEMENWSSTGKYETWSNISKLETWPIGCIPVLDSPPALALQTLLLLPYKLSMGCSCLIAKEHRPSPL